MVYEPPSALETTGVKPVILTGIFVQIIRNLFADPKNIEAPELRGYLWNSDPKLSRILIEPLYKWQPENIQQRPAVVIKRGAWKIERMGIGDKIHGPPEETGFTEETKIVAVAGSHSFFCIGNNGLEVEHLGTEVYQCLLGFSSVIREQFCLARFQVAEIGEPSKLEESHDHFVVPVNVAYSFTHYWKLIRQTPEWMRVALRTDSLL